jgi:predicted SprT family Zn-dependent metalloprotease
MLPIAARYTRRTEARKLAEELLSRHGLHDWTFTFNRRKRNLGLCRYQKKTIELSIFFVDRNGWDEIRDTLLHEIAHALVGPGHGHDGVWKAKCLEVGARPERCGEADMPAGRWRARCDACGQQFSRHRRPRRLKGWFCRVCGPERGGFVWRLARC